MAALILCSFVFCGSPASTIAADAGYELDNRMFAEGLKEIGQHYIRKVDLGEIALEGLAALGTIDNEISFRREGGQLALIYRGQPVDSFAVNDRLAPEGWATAMASALVAARRASAALKNADSEYVYAVTFNAMLAGFDRPFSRYVGREQALQDRTTRQGYAGIGVHVEVGGEGARITSVIANTPAEKAGLHADDIITAIDGMSTAGLDRQTVIGRLRGPVDSRVSLAIRAAGGSATTMTVTRANVAPETLKYQHEGVVAYFRLYQFSEGTADALRRGIETALANDGVTTRGIVLDLRDDPGGLLTQGVAVVDLFLNHGRILSIRGRDPKDDEAFEATAGDVTHGLPIAVLVNAGSASAAEIVASALQDNRRAVIIGSNSLGKGTVQTVHRMPNGGELILTVARFYAPSGYALHHLGVVPSICTSAGSEDASAILAKLGQGQLARLPIAERDKSSPDDTAGLDRIRAFCPGAQGTNPTDFDVASRLLAQPDLVTKAIELADPGAKVPK